MSLPRAALATLPTPLLAAPRLSDAVGVKIWIKRDDLTGLLLGGNKARKLEFLCGEALARGADTLVTGGGSGSNHVQLTAAAAARLGLDCVVVCYGSPPASEPVGLRLTRLLGGDVVFTGSPERPSVDARMEDVAAKLVTDGRVPYVIPRGGASAIGAVGYAFAAWELDSQLVDAGIHDPTVLLATGSCGTQAGLLAGTKVRIPRSGLHVVGVPVSRPAEECADRIARLATGCSERISAFTGMTGVFTAGDIELLDGYIGPGYGKPSPEGQDAADLAARTEGLVLDPVFTAKAMAALIAEARAGRFTGPVVFLHTGGTPAALAALP